MQRCGLAALLSAAAAVAYGDLHQNPPEEAKVRVVACNGFPSEEPANVGTRARHAAAGPKKALVTRTPSGLRTRDRGQAPIWTRPLAYGSCEEYYVALTGRELYFEAPGGAASCLARLPPGQADEDGWAVVVAQREARSTSCEVRAVPLPHRDSAKAAEVAVLDGYAQLRTLVPAEGAEAMSEFADDAAVRIEDPVDSDTIASETVGTRSLALGAAYAVAPGPFHVTLEDLRGAVLHDRKEAEFEGGKIYVLVRIGRHGDEHYPQRLVYFPCPSE